MCNKEDVNLMDPQTQESDYGRYWGSMYRCQLPYRSYNIRVSSCVNGTVVEIDSIFDTLPVRRKFLKSF